MKEGFFSPTSPFLLGDICMLLYFIQQLFIKYLLSGYKESTNSVSVIRELTFWLGKEKIKQKKM